MAVASCPGRSHRNIVSLWKVSRVARWPLAPVNIESSGGLNGHDGTLLLLALGL